MRQSKSGRVYGWVSALDEKPMWRHGRGSVMVREAGQRSGNGRRGDLGVGAEWRLFAPKGKSFGWGVSLKWGTPGSETTPDVAVHLSLLGDLWLHAEGLVPNRWLERKRPDGSADWDSRVFSVKVSAHRIEWEWWARDGCWSRDQPWWMYQSREWRTVFFGRDEVTKTEVESGTSLIPMPERNYPATYEITRYDHCCTRPLGRLRDAILGPRTRYLTNVKPGLPVPVPGKGENAWDCGDAGIYETSVGGRSVEAAVAAVVKEALDSRRRYGGEHMSMAAAAKGEDR